MDIDAIPIGSDFRHHIRGFLDKCDVLLAIIGPRWNALDENGHSRLEDEADWVRIEIETALGKNIRVIPVRVDGAMLPHPSLLPERMRDLVYRQAADLDTGRDFNPHMERLIRAIDGFALDVAGPRAFEARGRPREGVSPKPHSRGLVSAAESALELVSEAPAGTGELPETATEAPRPAECEDKAVSTSARPSRVLPWIMVSLVAVTVLVVALTMLRGTGNESAGNEPALPKATISSVPSVPNLPKDGSRVTPSGPDDSPVPLTNVPALPDDAIRARKSDRLPGPF